MPATTPVTTLLTTTAELLADVTNFGARVFVYRIPELAQGDLPCFVVAAPTANVKAQGWPPVGGEREQELRIFAEFDADTDADVASIANAVEYAAWATLHRDAAWCNLWTGAPSWNATTAADLKSNRRRCTVAITVRGSIAQAIDDPTGLVELHEIKATMTEPDGNAPGYTGPAYSGRVYLNPDEEA